VLFKSVQEKNKDIGKQFPLILTSGRLVEYEGGGDETRSNRYLAELQQEMFVEINPATANDRGIRNGEDVWVKTPTGARMKVKAQVTERVDKRNVFMPYPLCRPLAGRGHEGVLPFGRGADRPGRGRQHGRTYGYDPVTMMQETKTSVCQIERAA
jgi:formate dehydrogenase major subunit